MRVLKLINYLTVFVTAFLLGILYFEVTDIYDKTKEYPDHLHTTIYLDRNFNDVEQEYIMQAAMEWSNRTHHIVDIDVVQLPAHEKIDVAHCVIMIKVTADYPDIILMDNIRKSTTLGYFNDRAGLPFIALVTDRLDDSTFKPVVLHEIGHSLGLEHIEGEEGYLTLMYPYIDLGADHITQKDLVQFCKLYHCDPKKLKDNSED